MTRSRLSKIGATVALVTGVVTLSASATAHSHATDLRTYSACPTSDRRQLISSADRPASRLVPLGAREALVCRYSGVSPGQPAGRLLAQHAIDSQKMIALLTREFDALKPVQSGAYACPADFGVKIIAIFRYLPSVRSDDPVTLDPNGCEAVTNGRVTRTALLVPGPTLIGQLEALTANPK
jgi:hypothetical protein